MLLGDDLLKNKESAVSKNREVFATLCKGSPKRRIGEVYLFATKDGKMPGG
jgi:hypothetical protein